MAGRRNGILTWELGQTRHDGPQDGQRDPDRPSVAPLDETGPSEPGDGHRDPAGPRELGEPAETMVAGHLSSQPPRLGRVHAALDRNREVIDAAVGTGVSFDVVYREFRFGRARVGTYVINGFFESIVNVEMLKTLEWLRDEHAPADDERAGRGGGQGQRDDDDPLAALEALVRRHFTYSQVTLTRDLDHLVFMVMSGTMAVLLDGVDQAIIVDTRYYPDRNPSEPATERVVRGPHDGFTENLIVNAGLIRRRIRDPRLRYEILQAGVRTRMDVVLAYVEGLTDPQLVNELRRRLQSIHIDGVPMAEHDVAEFLTGWSWNPFPTVRFTERPDVAAFHLLEGHALVLVDTTPQVIIAPATLWNHLQHPEDFHLSPAMGTFMRWTQYVGLLAATLLPPLWLAFVLDPRLVHALPGLAFIGPKKPSGFPIGLQLIGAEFTLDILRRAILNTPDSLAQTMGIVGAIVLGDVAAKAGVFSSEALVYIVLAAIGQFAISSIELGAATRLVRFSLLVATWGFRFPGLLVGVALWLIVLLQTRTFGIPYTWPLIPFDWVAFRTMLYRPPVMVRPPRPAALRTQNRSRE